MIYGEIHENYSQNTNRYLQSKKNLDLGSICVVGGGDLVEGPALKALKNDVLDLLIPHITQKRRTARAARIAKRPASLNRTLRNDD
jgi:hypothetical protein